MLAVAAPFTNSDSTGNDRPRLPRETASDCETQPSSPLSPRTCLDLRSTDPPDPSDPPNIYKRCPLAHQGSRNYHIPRAGTDGSRKGMWRRHHEPLQHNVWTISFPPRHPRSGLYSLRSPPQRQAGRTEVSGAVTCPRHTHPRRRRPMSYGANAVSRIMMLRSTRRAASSMTTELWCYGLSGLCFLPSHDMLMFGVSCCY